MNFEFNGKLIVKNDVVVVSDKFKKREFVVETSETGSNGQTFTEQVLFQLTQDRVNLLDVVNVGDDVAVNFNVRGRAWQKTPQDPVRYFNNLEAWRVNKVDGTQQPANAPDLGAAPAEEDDLPF